MLASASRCGIQRDIKGYFINEAVCPLPLRFRSDLRRRLEEFGVVGQCFYRLAGGEVGVHFMPVFDAVLAVLPAEAYLPAGGE